MSSLSAIKPLPFLKYLLLWAIGGALLYLAFRGVPLEEVWGTLQKANGRWVWAVIAATLFNHLARVLRWRLLMEPLGIAPSVGNTFRALEFGYLVNLAIPRLGELSRCATLQRSEGSPFRPVLGTVITERLVDVACLGAVSLMALGLEADRLEALYQQEVSPVLEVALQSGSEYTRWWGAALLLLAVSALALAIRLGKKLGGYPWGRLLLRFVRQVWRGVGSISNMPQKWAFLFYTIVIWLTYYLMTWLWFFSFPDTAGLGWQAGLAILVIGSLGRSLPIQGGGLGAYHYVYAQGLGLYGVDIPHSMALAVMTHGLQLLFNLVVGGGSAVLILLQTKFRKNEPNEVTSP